MSMCKRCQQSHEAHSLVSCAFPKGVFSPNNWNCGTMQALRRLVMDEELEEKPQHFFQRQDDSRIAVIALPDRVVSEAEEEAGLVAQYGWLVMSWYKERGRISQALVIDEDNAEPLRLETAEYTLEKLSPRNTGEVEGSIATLPRSTSD